MKKFQIFYSTFNGVEVQDTVVETVSCTYDEALDKLIAWNQKNNTIYMLRKA